MLESGEPTLLTDGCFCSLKTLFSSSDHTASKEKVNDELERLRKEVIVVYFQLQSPYLP
jgi:hypothetical protein